MKLKIMATLTLLFVLFGAKAQDVALKTNVLYDAALSPQIALEVGTAPKWSLELGGQLNAWKVDGHLWKHWMVQPEARYWFCNRFAGHFVGVHALGGQYNVGHFNLPVKFLGTDFREFKDYRWQGWMAGAGVAYGYAWILDRHWNLEAELGLGWIYTRHDTYRCAKCGKKVNTNVPHNYFGPTKAAINISYIF